LTSIFKLFRTKNKNTNRKPKHNDGQTRNYNKLSALHVLQY